MLAEWETKRGMAFHPQKCNVLSVTRYPPPIRFNYRLKGHILELQDSTNTLVWTCIRHCHGKTTSTGSPRRLIVCWGSCDAIYGHAKKITKPTPILPWSDQIWSTVHQYGTHIIKIKYTSWKWFRECQQGLPRISTETPVVFPLCWTIFNGSH